MTEMLIEPTVHEATPEPSASPAALTEGWWARGLNLAERVNLPGAPRPVTGAGDRASRRLARWRDTYQLGETGQFDRRLAEVGLTETELLALLEESAADLASRAAAPPAWAEITEAVLARVAVASGVPQRDAGAEVPWQAGFNIIVAPFMEYGYERLATAATAEGLDALVDFGDLHRNFVSALGQSQVMLAARTLVLELNVLRVTGRLHGETPQQRFWAFAQHFAQQSGLAALFDEYPVLARLLAQGTAHAVENWLELLRRYAADRKAIVTQVFHGTDPGRLVEVTAGRGDAHHRGRTVAILRFAGGAQLVYKPRPLAAHVHFNAAVDWLNRQVAGLGLRILTVFDRGLYGWVEFAEHRPCEDRAAVERYHRRQGALLGLLYALDGWDFHFENVIASGDQPMLVDMEALFHPKLPVSGPDLLTEDPAMAAFDTSVSTVGLLPMLVFGDGGVAIDLSGNGGDAGRPMPFKDPGWADAGTDAMRLIREHHPFPGSQNRVRLGDTDVDACEFADEFIAGFRTAYDAIVARREELAGSLVGFVDDELRVVVRATRAYGTLLYESTHPDALRDALDRDRVLDYLWAISSNNPALELVVEHERTDLWAGDIPFFTTRPDSRDAWTSTGVRVPELLVRAGMESAANKIAEMGERDRGVQEWIISASFVTRRAAATITRELQPQGGNPGPAVTGGTDVAVAVNSERVLAAARAVGDLLADSAYVRRGRVGWLGLDFVDNSRWTVQPLRYDLYGGYPGIAIFLSQLAALTGEERYAVLAHQTLAPVQQLVESAGGPDEAAAGCGVFTSLAGMAYALVHVAANIGEPALLAPVEPILDALPSGVSADVVLDVIGGSAGQLVAMLAIHEATGVATALEVARLCADQLVSTALQQDHGIAWHTTIEATQPLTGFSHGVAGIGWALLRYAAATGEQRYADMAFDAFRYERSLYRPDAGNWPDFRVLDGTAAEPAVGQHAWCHGSPGVGLARADSRHTSHPEVAADLDLAVQAMLVAPPTPNLSLCHGELGNLELLTAAIANGRPELAAHRADWGARALAEFDRSGPVCGTPGGISTPGLMTGLAGIGHGLLRLGFPDRVPSVLLLQAPRRRPW